MIRLPLRDKYKPLLTTINMKYITLIALVAFIACETPAFDGDKRQIMAKNYIRSQIGRNRSLSITGFGEDTLDIIQQPLLEKPIRYAISFNYKDSTDAVVTKKAVVLFTPDGHSIVQAEIVDAP